MYSEVQHSANVLSCHAQVMECVALILDSPKCELRISVQIFIFFRRLNFGYKFIMNFMRIFLAGHKK